MEYMEDLGVLKLLTQAIDNLKELGRVWKTKRDFRVQIKAEKWKGTLSNFCEVLEKMRQECRYVLQDGGHEDEVKIALKGAKDALEELEGMNISLLERETKSLDLGSIFRKRIASYIEMAQDAGEIRKERAQIGPEADDVREYITVSTNGSVFSYMRWALEEVRGRLFGEMVDWRAIYYEKVFCCKSET
ncbi:hypothetical protein IKF15_03730 [Candidatus Saccharibacteria bacterium]|nr:hypothetical protein [Candidatus Saccharibacteria bacterium]